MKTNFYKDCLIYNLAKIFGCLLRIIPPNIALFMGRLLGTLAFYLDKRHSRIAYKNLKCAFQGKKSPEELSIIVRKMYQHLAQNIIEMLLIPRIDGRYLDKYIKMEGKENIGEGLKEDKGLIFLSIHLGNWELSNCVCAFLFCPYNLIVKEQTRYSRLDNLLNSYRQSKGVNIISKGVAAREIIECIKNREILVLVGDQGGRDGIAVSFFNRLTSVPTGAIRLALKFGVPVIPAFIIRRYGPYHRIIVHPPLEIVNSGELNKDLKNNLERFNRIVEDVVSQAPEQYLWLYKVWKYSPQRQILILSDGKAGHLRQSQTIAKILAQELEAKGFIPKIIIKQVKLRNRLSKILLNLYRGSGLIWLKRCLEPYSYIQLSSSFADIIISCGRSLSIVNYILSTDNLAKSIHIMRPQALISNKLDLVFLPQHDRCRKRPNTIITQISPNLIDEKYLQTQARALLSRLKDSGLELPRQRIALLVGGDTKEYIISKKTIKAIIAELKKLAEQLNLELLVTTSRRTSADIEKLIKKELQDYPKCKLLIIANENNIPEAVGGMLGLGSIVVVSGESISMISEAVSSGKYVLVFGAQRRFGRFGKTRHKRFLDNLSHQGYITLIRPQQLSEEVFRLLSIKPPLKTINDNQVIREALGKIL